MQRKRQVGVLLLLVLLLAVRLPENAAAQQISFTRQDYTAKTQFNIAFTDSQQQKRQLSFLITDAALASSQQGIPALGRLQKIVRDEAIQNSQIASAKSREKIQMQYEQIYQNLLSLTNQANEELKPWYQISLTREGEADFGVKRASNTTAAISYYWKTPSLGIATESAIAIQDMIKDLTEDANHALEGKGEIRLSFIGKKINLTVHSSSGSRQKAKEALEALQAKISLLLDTQKKAAGNAERKFSEITNFIDAQLQQLKLAAESETESFKIEYRTLYNQLLAQHHLTLVNYHKQDIIRIDYQQVVYDYIPQMRPVALALTRAMPVSASLRDYVSAALNFVQSIPYDELRVRNLKTLSGFLLPLDMVAQNRGDCDTKSAALLAILSNIMPQHQFIMVIIPNHAFIGVNIPPLDTDMVYKYKAEHYVLMEVAGPAVLPVGKMGKISLQALKKDKILEIIPMMNSKK